MTSSEHPRRSKGAFIVMLISLAGYTFLDLASKEWALETLSHARAGDPPPICEADAHGYSHMQRIPSPPLVLVDGYLLANYAENCGAAFSMLRTAPGWLRGLIFGVAAVGACVVLTVMFMRGSGGALFAAAVPLILSGAVGNLSDRIRHGFVVDFIQVDPRLFNYPVFNVADIAISIGVGLLLLDGLRKPAPGGQREDAKSVPPSEHRA